jgi:hypothetical protein
MELPVAIARLTGISGGAAPLIPGLLRPDLARSASVLDLQDPVEDGHEPIDGTDCVRISGRQAMAEMTLWLGSSDSMLRRVRRSMRMDAEQQALLSVIAAEGDLAQVTEDLSGEEVGLETEIRYLPETGVDLADSEFEDGAVLDGLKLRPRLV